MFRKPPPPTKFTATDKFRLLLGALAIILGVVILWRTASIGITPPAIILGLAFIGFGVYRLWLGYTRLKQLKSKGQG